MEVMGSVEYSLMTALESVVTGVVEEDEKGTVVKDRMEAERYGCKYLLQLTSEILLTSS